MVNNINKYLLKSGVYYANEIRMGIGIPDISLNLGANKRIKYIDDYYMLAVLDFVTNKKETTFQEIRENFIFTLERVKKYVLQLANMSLVSIKNQIVRVIKNIFKSKLGTTIAIEAKIKDWKNGYIQAQRYLSCSDYSYLALQERYVSNVDLELLKRARIGLLSVQNDSIEEVLPAVISSECDFCLKYIHTSSIVQKYGDSTIKYIRKKNNLFSRYAIV